MMIYSHFFFKLWKLLKTQDSCRKYFSSIENMISIGIEENHIGYSIFPIDNHTSYGIYYFSMGYWFLKRITCMLPVMWNRLKTKVAIYVYSLGNSVSFGIVWIFTKMHLMRVQKWHKYTPFKHWMIIFGCHCFYITNKLNTACKRGTIICLHDLVWFNESI